MKAWLFNPENDLALADGGIRYTPPRGALAVARAGRLLPMLWASDDDEILVPESQAYDDVLCQAKVLRESYGGRGTVVTQVSEVAVPSPWGWSCYARNVFEKAGVDAINMPSDASLHKIRELSHRRISITVNQALCEWGRDVEMPPCPMEVRNYDRICEWAHRFEEAGYEGVVVKLPWSCSSRGVVMASSDRLRSLKEQIEGMIRRQGSVMIEAWVRRKCDFAMLFEADGHGCVEYRALSMFVTDPSGRYEGNLVMTQDDIADRIGPLPDGLGKMLEKVLAHTLGSDYKGWIGVDMMKYDHLGREGLAPCVEVNLRMTMGVAAFLMSDRILRHTDARGLLIGVTPAGIRIQPVSR